MKKLFFLFFLPLWGLGGSAHASVTVTPLSTDFINKTVTFRVEYANAANNRAWIWIDLCPVSGVTPSTFQTAVISAASATGNNVIYSSTNTRGFFVTASPSTVIATLSNATGKFNWCAYGSDAPPNVMAANGTYTFKGTPPFILTAANGATTQTVAGKTLPASALTMTPVILTDRTGYPGIFCPYQGSDLLIDATHFCQQRTSGAKNWEAWIKDARDNQIYRIAQLSTGLWTMDDYLNYNHSSAWAPSRCSTADLSGKEYRRSALTTTYASLCPTGWRLPSQIEFETTATDWKLHLTKQYKNTGESIYLSDGRGYDCQGANEYLSFIVNNCFNHCGGQRLVSINPVNYTACPTACQNSCLCLSHLVGSSYGGYARCVHDL